MKSLETKGLLKNWIPSESLPSFFIPPTTLTFELRESTNDVNFLCLSDKRLKFRDDFTTSSHPSPGLQNRILDDTSKTLYGLSHGSWTKWMTGKYRQRWGHKRVWISQLLKYEDKPLFMCFGVDTRISIKNWKETDPWYTYGWDKLYSFIYTNPYIDVRISLYVYV